MNVLAAFLTTISVLAVLPVSEQLCKRRVCYYDGDAISRPTPESRLLPENIDTKLCSHIIYVKSQLSKTGIIPNYSKDESTNNYVGIYEKVTGLKKGNTGMKVLLALQIKPYHSNDLSEIASSESSRKKFAANVIQFLRKRHFDGLDVQFYIHGYHTSKRAGIKHAISQILETLRQAFNGESCDYSRLLLTVAVHGRKLFDDETYDVLNISINVDWINLLAYDFRGDWDEVTGFDSPLYPDPKDKGGNAMFSVDTAVRHWVGRGTPKDKIVVAIIFRGYPFILTSSNTGVGAPIKGTTRGQYTKRYHSISQFEICELINKGPFENHYLYEQGAAYLVSGNLWISYDEAKTVIQKVKYIKDQGLGGLAAYPIDYDDFTGHFCGRGPYPLLKAINTECNV